MAHSETLTAKQAKLIAALLDSRTLEDAAKKAEVSRSQAYRYLDDPGFKTALRKAEDDLLDATTRRLLHANGFALDTLLRLMATAKSEAVRARCALGILEFTLRIKEARDFGDRIAALEAALNAQQS